MTSRESTVMVESEFAHTKFEPRKILTRRNFRIDLDDDIIYMYVGFSKTNQFGQRDLVLPIPGNRKHELPPGNVQIQFKTAYKW